MCVFYDLVYRFIVLEREKPSKLQQNQDCGDIYVDKFDE